MLTQSHYAARRLVRCGDKPAYRKHMCGVCHALGDDYGLPYRLLTNHDTILLNLLTGAQCADESATVMRRCPLNPARFVRTNQDDASRFAAAVSVGLANASVEDDIADTDGHALIARLGRAVLPSGAALRQLTGMGFDAAALETLTAQQSAAEAIPDADPAAPTAAVSAALFTMTARLAGNPMNKPALAIIGAHYGTYIYLADAHRDLAQDIRHGDFNPLRPFAQDGALSAAGKVWLAAHIEALRSAIQTALDNLTLYRDTVRYLLTAPLDDLLATLRGVDVGGACCAMFADSGERKKHKRHDGWWCDGSDCDCCCDCCDCCDCCGRRGRRGDDDCDCDCCDGDCNCCGD